MRPQKQAAFCATCFACFGRQPRLEFLLPEERHETDAMPHLIRQWNLWQGRDERGNEYAQSGPRLQVRWGKSWRENRGKAKAGAESGAAQA